MVSKEIDRAKAIVGDIAREIPVIKDLPGVKEGGPVTREELGRLWTHFNTPNAVPEGARFTVRSPQTGTTREASVTQVLFAIIADGISLGEYEKSMERIDDFTKSHPDEADNKRLILVKHRRDAIIFGVDERVKERQFGEGLFVGGCGTIQYPSDEYGAISVIRESEGPVSYTHLTLPTKRIV